VKKLVCYLRVSTTRQGKSGLGLDAQLQAVQQYATSIAGKVIATFTEVETGNLNARPELAQALHLTKVTGATLVIAKLDRLSRNAAFLLAMQDSGVKFIAADIPQANNLTIGIMALVAQQEGEAISKRTKDALQAAKRRGKLLGNPNGAEALRRAAKGNIAAVAAIKENANKHALNLLPIIQSLKSNGVCSLGAIATVLNERGMLTPRGGAWHKTSVKNLLTRLSS
jgi:DNA invertase Pin-like site-specific DNA recombinase